MIELFERDPTDGFYHVVALSGGHDSTILSVLLKEREPRVYNYVCTPTGDELPEMFEHWRRLGEILGKRLIPIMGGTLKAMIRQEGYLPNFRARWCTKRLKILPYRRVLRALTAAAPVISYVGLRYDEQGTAGGAFEDIDGVVMRFPLREWEMDDPMVLAALAERGIVCPNRTDCARCYHQRIGEWFELWRDNRDLFYDAIVDEVELGATFRTPGRDTWPADLASMAIRFEAGDVPTTSLNRLARERESQKVGACRACTL